MRLVRSALVLVAVLAAAPASAGALTVGIADQHPTAWQDARLIALGLPVARLIVPYNAVTYQPAEVQAWLDAVAAAGQAPHVAFEHLRTDSCPDSPCTTPTRAQYAAAVRAFIARWPQVRTYTTWNEANHRSQPVATRPEIVAGYYEELVAACPGCTIVAGDVLDSSNHGVWLSRFRNATSLNPQLWGLHNYGDVTHDRTSGTDAALAAVSGQFWVEETGGIVRLRGNRGSSFSSASEADAALAVRRAFAIARARPRITRMYVYQWRANSTDRFDSGLLRPDGGARPSYSALVEELRGTAAPVAATAPGTARFVASWSTARRGRVVLRASCRPAGTVCSGRVAATLRLSGARSVKLGDVAFRVTRTTARQVLAVNLPSRTVARARRAKARSVALRIRPSGATRATAVALKLARPR